MRETRASPASRLAQCGFTAGTAPGPPRCPRARHQAWQALVLAVAATVATPPSNAAGTTAASYKAAPGPRKVATATAVWTDATRGREVPLRVFAPEPVAGERPLPLIVFSHGFGETGDSYPTLQKHWASWGYIVLSPTHRGSDREALEARRAGREPVAASYADRPRDLSFVIDRALAGDHDVDLIRGRIDPERIGAAGHSIGSSTVLSLVGLETQTGPGGAKATYVDERIDAVIPMSPQIGSAAGTDPAAPTVLDTFLDETAWARIEKPVLVMIGTRDTGNGYLRTNPGLRRIVFDRLPAGAGKYELDVQGLQHHAFTDTEPYYGGDPRLPEHHGWIEQATVAFWDAFLVGAESARGWLEAGALDELTGGRAAQDWKRAGAAGATDRAESRQRYRIAERPIVRGEGATYDFRPATAFLRNAEEAEDLPGLAMMIVDRHGATLYAKELGELRLDAAVPLGRSGSGAGVVVSAAELAGRLVELMREGADEGASLAGGSAGAAGDWLLGAATAGRRSLLLATAPYGSTAWIDESNGYGGVFVTYRPGDIGFRDQLVVLFGAIVEHQTIEPARLDVTRRPLEGGVAASAAFAGSSVPKGPPGAPGMHSLRFDSTGEVGTYELYVPTRFEELGALPLVVMFHRGGTSGGMAARETGWAETAERHGFLVAFPDGSGEVAARGEEQRFGGWNDGSGRGLGRDDVLFTRDLVADIESRFDVDRNRIFLTGLMIGASMAFRAGYELPDLVSAIAPVTGHFMLEDPEPLERPVPMLCILGTHDLANPMMLDVVRISGGTGLHKPYVRDSVLKWVGVLDLPLASDLLWVRDDVLLERFGPGGEGEEVQLYIVEGQDQSWPAEKLDANQIIWDFFQRHARAGSIPNSRDR